MGEGVAGDGPGRGHHMRGFRGNDKENGGETGTGTGLLERGGTGWLAGGRGGEGGEEVRRRYGARGVGLGCEPQRLIRDEGGPTPSVRYPLGCLMDVGLHLRVPDGYRRTK